MYRLEYLPSARQDLIDIVSYITNELENPNAAGRIASKLTTAADGLCSFPYAHPVYIPIRPLNYEYRKLVVQNYIIFYWVDEIQKTVTVARVINSKQDYSMIERLKD